MILICCSFRPTLSPDWWLKTEPASRCSRSIPEVLHSVAARHESREMPRGCTARPRPFTEKLGIWGWNETNRNMFRGFFPGWSVLKCSSQNISPFSPPAKRNPSRAKHGLQQYQPRRFPVDHRKLSLDPQWLSPPSWQPETWGNEIPTKMGRFLGGTILDAESFLVPFGQNLILPSGRNGWHFSAAIQVPGLANTYCQKQ